MSRTWNGFHAWQYEDALRNARRRVQQAVATVSEREFDYEGTMREARRLVQRAAGGRPWEERSVQRT